MRPRCVAVMVALLVLVLQVTEGTIWKVGDSKGWQLNVDYAQWIQGKVFEVGDSLLFTYNKTKENVLEVSAADFASCTTIDPIATYTDGNSTVLLSNYTTRLFISGFPGHCLAGVMLEIIVGSPAPSPSPSPMPPSISPALSPIQPVVSPPPSSPPPPLRPGMSSPPPFSNFAPQSLEMRRWLAPLLATCLGASLIL